MSVINSQLESKLKDMQQYLPFLQSVIDKLRSNNEHQKDNPRKAQLMKMEMLQDLLTNKANKLKMDTLLKCEGVLIKLHAKIEKNENDISKPDHISNTSKQNSDKVAIVSENKDSKVEIIDITGPESPPPQPIEEVEPVEIPTERLCSPVVKVVDTNNEKQTKSHRRRHHTDERRIHYHHSEKTHHQNRNVSHGKSNEQSKCEKSSSISTTVTSTRCSNVSIEHDYQLGSSRSPNKSQNATCSLKLVSNCQNESTQYVRRQACWDDDNVNSNDVYSPEECWDELTSKQKPDQPAVTLVNSPSSPICGAEVDYAYHDTIFNFKKQNTMKQKPIFTRLGEKIDTAKPFENFKVNVQNEQLLVKTCQRKPLVSPIASTAVKIPTIPEVLKSPPLSENDISDLLNDSIDKNNFSDICEIGTRRPAKTNLNTKGTDAKTSNLDMVRKKFAMVTKGSAQLNKSIDESNSPGYINTNPSPFSNERLALKYNPHPRTDRNIYASSQSGNEQPTQESYKSSDPRLNSVRGNLNTPCVPKMSASSCVKPQDPRLRKPASGSVPPHHTAIPHIAPLLPTTAIMESVPLIRATPSVTNFQMRSYSASSPNFRPGATLMSYQNPHNFAKPKVQQFRPADPCVLFSRRDSYDPEFLPHYHLNTQQISNIPVENVVDNFASEDTVNSTTMNLTANESNFPACRNGYTSEENWDSEPDEVPAKEKIGFSKSKNYKSFPISSNDSNFEKNMCRKKASQKNEVSHNSSVFTSTLRPRFSAVLNDKSERIKYFESKKQKHAEPHTYAEYKKAKARAAAEEAANKLTEQTAKITGENSNSIKTAESTLDKLYRNSNFKNCEFPKTKTTFKIPKKQQETVTTKNVQPSHQDKSAECKESFKKAEFVSNEPLLNEEMLIVNSKENPLTKECEKEKCPTLESKPDENKQGKTVVPNSRKQTFKEVAKTAETKANIKVLKEGEGHISKQNKLNKENSTILKSKPVAKKVGADFEQKQQTNDGSVESKLNVQAASTEGPATKTGAFAVGEIVLSSKNEKQSSLSSEPTDGIIKSNEELKTSVLNRPARILKRRNTMFDQGSLPLVDKEKLFSATALVFEDIQGNERLRSRADIDLKQNKKNRTLAYIFQKTDDNCTVSTQNIISGKRRTRTTVNFNEVQRSLEVFQHKKPREPRKDVCTEVTKKSPPKIKKVSNIKITDGPSKEQIQIKKKNKLSTNLEDEYENQNCAVSSTTFHLEEEAADTSAVRENKSIAENVCEPSSSTAKTMNATSTTDDDKKAELLEGFVQDILKPNANTEYIFSLLRQILSDEKLKLVKEIVESAAKENAKNFKNDDDDGEFERHDEKEAEDSGKSDKKTTDDLKSPQEKKQAPNKKAPKRKAKRNELDRLNEDIRDMFISKGVLTATGRRMCTLVAAEKANTSVMQKSNCNETDEANIKKKTTPQSEIAKKFTSDKESKPAKMPKSPGGRKPHIKEKTLTMSYNDDTNSDNDCDESILHDSEMGTTDTTTDIDGITSLTEELTDNTLNDTPPRGMPILKAHTPIKQSDVEDDKINSNIKRQLSTKKRKVQVKLVKLKSSAKCVTSVKSSDMQSTTSSDSEKEADNEKIELTSRGLEKTNHEKSKQIKNTNSNWHSQSEYAKCCVVCNVKLHFTGSHYKQHHAENFTSRLAPNVLAQYKQNAEKSKALFGVIHKKQTMWFYRCPFCLQHNSTMLVSWLEHFNTHTGEYYFECSRCHRPSNKQHSLEKHIKTQCTGATVVRNCTPITGVLVKAHVCHLCNFLQIYRQNLNRHYIEQHDYDPSEVGSLGYTINLLDLKDVKIVDNKTAIDLETEALESLSNGSTIDVLDDAIVDAADKSVGKKIEPKETVNKDKDDVNKNNTVETISQTIDREIVTSTSENSISPSINQNSNKNTVQRELQSVEQLCANTNIFMPTREANDSPTMNNFTQSLLTIENEQVESLTSDHNGISIAERLSQRFKNLKEQSVRSNVVSATEKQLEANDERNNTVTAYNDTSSSSNVYKSTSATEKRVVTEVSSQSSSVLNKSSESEGCLVIADNDTDVSTELAEKGDDSNSEDDEDNWEDIEITESAPSTTSSIVSTSSGISKISRAKNKTVYQKFNRLYASNNKLKKSLSITMGNKKKFIDKPAEQFAPISIATTSTLTTEFSVAPTVCNNDNLASTTVFRPIISNLADLLPDSPCNDPIELVPELTPLAPLQDLNDISSILDSDYMSNMYFPNTATSINIDHQQTSIQEALDFVSEQENQLDSNTHLSSSGGQNVQMQASINRVENIGYTVSSDESGFRFYCLSENCTFIYSSESIGLEAHFLSEHPEKLWKGFCHTCKTQVNTDCELTLSAELKHMHEKHTNFSRSAPSEELLSHSVLFVNHEERPRIKIRRLTGDCLSSTTTPTSPSGSSKSASTIDENTNSRPPTSIIPSCSNNCIDEPLFRNATSELWITSVTSGATTPCQLQIASVVSLNEECKEKDKVKDNNFPTTAEKSVYMPNISNVCSLDGVEKTRMSCSKLTEIEKSSLNNSLGTSHSLDNVKEPSIQQTASDVMALTNSPELQVVSETVPVAQATSGEYLITQTLSANYEEGCPGAQLGFNISIATNSSAYASHPNSGICPSPPINQATSTSQELSVYKCMSGGCKYQTRVPVAIRDHLQFHERHNFANKRDYLRCSLCTNTAGDIKEYFEHLKTTHTHCNTGALTQSIQTISNRSQSESNESEKSGTTVPKTSNANTKKETKSSFIEQLKNSIDEMLANTGIEDSKLYRCTFDGCKVTLSESNYFAHIADHVSSLRNVNANNYSYKCPHCTGSYRQCKIKMHIKSHARHRYFCYLCRNTAINSDQILKHFKEKHWGAKNMYSTPLIRAEDKDMSGVPIYYVAYSQKLTESDVEHFCEKLIMDWMRKKEGSRTHFKPSEISLLPLTPIFQKELNCSICAYKTKVRTNLLRHLQLHSDENSGSGQQVANVDPVNPVPCLNTNEKHFDKMTNLASSSLVTGGSSGPGVNANTNSCNSNPGSKPNAKVIYDYVPETKRYTCGVSGCQYLTISDDIFRSHLNALHTDISNYKCPLCKEEICKRSMSVERILQHLRFHGKKLYQCEECEYLHYMKNVVERHIHDKHPTKSVNLVTYDRTNSTTGKTTIEQITCKAGTAVFDATAVHSKIETVATKSKQKWLCNICGHKAITQQQMVTHCSTQHGSKHQYQCTHCSFSAAQLSHIMSHIDEKHVGKMREVRHVFHKLAQQNDPENSANTRPLWLRDDPTRVRHIRGILMEDEEESEQYCKRLCLEEDSETSAINDETDKPHVQYPDNTLRSSYEFGCFYCHKRFTNLNELRKIHWKSVHGICPETTNPFQFYLIKLLKCCECQIFTGSWHELQLHSESVHNSNRYIAIDINTSSTGLTCGYCDFSCQTAEQLVKHNRRLQHKLADIKGLTNCHLKDILKLGITETYIQCSMCLDIFANRPAIVAHASSAHIGEEGFCFRELTDTLIYRCTKCVYTSTHELTTLRHMIDHYEGFKRCHFCHEPQTTFNGYMQHCYSDHREAIKQFSDIYPFHEIQNFLQDMQVLFPNGLLISVHNLQRTQHNGIVRMNQLYAEICKTSQQPPIPRLSIARLVASKSYDGKKGSNQANFPDDDNSRSSASVSTAAAMQLAGNGGKNSLATLAAKRILKRRSTVAHGSEEIMANLFTNKKRRLANHSLVLPPPKPETHNRSRSNSPPIGTANACSVDELPELQPFSFYGQPVEFIDLNNIYTRIAITGVDTRVNILKFKMLCKIDAHVVVEKVNLSKFGGSRVQLSSSSASAVPYENIKKACPASHKYKYARSSRALKLKSP